METLFPFFSFQSFFLFLIIFFSIVFLILPLLLLASPSLSLVSSKKIACAATTPDRNYLSLFLLSIFLSLSHFNSHILSFYLFSMSLFLFVLFLPFYTLSSSPFHFLASTLNFVLFLSPLLSFFISPCSLKLSILSPLPIFSLSPFLLSKFQLSYSVPLSLSLALLYILLNVVVFLFLSKLSINTFLTITGLL